MRNSGSLEDRMLIRELYGLYADASSRGDVDDWLACWAEDCQWHSHIFNCSGKPALRRQWHVILEPIEAIGFLSELGPVEVTGDSAKARSYAREIARLKNGGLLKLIGRYDDEMVRVNGTWLFARRDYRPLVQELPE